MELTLFVLCFLLESGNSPLNAARALQEQYPTTVTAFCEWHDTAVHHTNSGEVAGIDTDFVLYACGTNPAYLQFLENGDTAGARKFAREIFAHCTRWWGDASACNLVPAGIWAERTGWSKKELMKQWEKSLPPKAVL